MNIQNKLKEFRLKANLSQRDVAEKLGFESHNRICRWEKGIAYPSVPNLFKLSDLYGVKPDELINWVKK
jgi:transcriptional regulator with XRE-family HTH domain